MTKTEEIIAKHRKYVARNYSPVPVVPAGASNVAVVDIEGRSFVDMMSCYSAVSVGHRHPKILAELNRQANNLANVSRAFFNNQLPDYAELLCSICKMNVMLPMNTGAEAVETAIKIARKWGYKKKNVPKDKAEIIVCDNNFHGRTTTIVGFSSEDQYKDSFGPFTPGFVSVPFGDIDSLQKAINKNTVAFLIEPIQGEAGVVLPPRGFLAKARVLCMKNNVLFIADEIQTGLGRTGKIFACDHEGVRPSMYILGKALGGGVMPVSAVVSHWQIMDVINPGDHGSTFGGGPLACAVAKKYLEIMLEEKLAENSKKLGEYLKKDLLKIKSPYVKEVRGKGLFIGVELKRNSGGAKHFAEELAKVGVLTSSTHDFVLRFAPPLTITKDHIDWAIERIKKVLTTKN
ncbi:MAG: ornithine--oxo-acid transaminase [Candidatus Marinimicrobia bacterium]|nr:ornithine--oxo-acid transaminase [Candidatus Neomarinimicrobiota bacterium]